MMLEKLLEELVGRRFDSLEHLKLTLDTDFRGIDSTVDYVDYEDMDEPEFWESQRDRWPETAERIKKVQQS